MIILVPTRSFKFLLSELPKSRALLRNEVSGHDGFDFEWQLHGQEKINTIFDCSAGFGLPIKDPRIVPIKIEDRGDDKYLVFDCYVGKGESGERQNEKDVAILISKPVEEGLQVDVYDREGFIEITNSQGDKYWLYF